MTEKRLQDNLIRCLNIDGVCGMGRNNVGRAVYDGQSVSYGVFGRGAPDLVGWDFNGVFTVIEVKGARGALNAHQKLSKERFLRHPHINYYLCRPNNVENIVLAVAGEDRFEFAMSRWK